MTTIYIKDNELVSHIEYDVINYSTSTQTGTIPYTLKGDGVSIERVYEMNATEGQTWEQDDYIKELILAKENMEEDALPPETPVE